MMINAEQVQRLVYMLGSGHQIVLFISSALILYVIQAELFILVGPASPGPFCESRQRLVLLVNTVTHQCKWVKITHICLI